MEMGSVSIMIVEVVAISLWILVTTVVACEHLYRKISICEVSNAVLM
jgi:hypothetical protein